MKRILITIVAVAGVGGLIALLTYHPHGAKVANGTVKSDAAATPAASSSAAVVSSPAAGTAYKDGTYTGNAVDVGYGAVQVQAVVAGGKITAVNFLQMPGGEDHTVMVTDEAKPVLLKEAIEAQSANVDSVSGATQDTQGFTKSLQSALDQAS